LPYQTGPEASIWFQTVRTLDPGLKTGGFVDLKNSTEGGA